MKLAEKSGLSGLWSLLASRAPEQGRLRAYRFKDAPRIVFASLSEDSHRGLLVEVGEREALAIPGALLAAGSGALAASVRAYDPDGVGPRRFVHIVCGDHDADQAFDAFCELFELKARSVPVGRALAECMEEFRRLLSGDQGEATSEEIGLLGELIALRAMVTSSPGLADAWMGPSKGRHDFRRGNVAVEVKTTLRSAASGRTVRISDLDQLEPPEGGRLFLHLIRLENVQNGDLSIDRLVEEIGRHLDSTTLANFERTILSMEVAPLAARRTYSLRESATFEVRQGFPAITRSHLIGGCLVPGVTKVSYNLALENAAEFQTSFDEVMTAMRGTR